MKSFVLIRKKMFWLVMAALLLAASGIYLKTAGPGGALWAVSRGGAWFLPVLAAAAVVDSINPCAFSILLLTIAFLVSLGAVRRRIVAAGVLYIAGIFAVYLLIGLGILQALHLFNTPHFMAKVGASVLIAFGLLDLAGEFIPGFPIKLRIPAGSHRAMAALLERGTLITSFLLGAFVGLCEFPCTGGPYLFVLGLLHDRATFTSGLAYLFLYNAIFVLPLVVILALGSDAAVLARVQAWKTQNSGRMRWFGGAAMIALGLLMFAF